MQKECNSIANTLELHLFGIKQSETIKYFEFEFEINIWCWPQYIPENMHMVLSQCMWLGRIIVFLVGES